MYTIVSIEKWMYSSINLSALYVSLKASIRQTLKTTTALSRFYK